MPIVAALISRGTTILVEYGGFGTNFSTIARRLIESIPTTLDSKKSYSYENYNFHYLVEGGVIYLCMASQDFTYRVSYNFLFDISNRFKNTYGSKIQTAGPLGMNDTFSRVLKERIEFFSNDKGGDDKISKVKGEIEDTKKVMVQNIDKVLERGSKIEELVDKTDTLQSHSHSFRNKGRQLRRNMWWKNCKLCCILLSIILIILIIVIVVVLWKYGVFK